jgi:hypothetical protein
MILSADLGAQSDSARAAANTLHGAWSATSGTMALMGSWTAVLTAPHGSVIGTWTLNDNEGKIVMSGLWSASKAADRWYGNWRANVAGRGGEYNRNVGLEHRSEKGPAVRRPVRQGYLCRGQRYLAIWRQQRCMGNPDGEESAVTKLN